MMTPESTILRRRNVPSQIIRNPHRNSEWSSNLHYLHQLQKGQIQPQRRAESNMQTFPPNTLTLRDDSLDNGASQPSYSLSRDHNSMNEPSPRASKVAPSSTILLLNRPSAVHQSNDDVYHTNALSKRRKLNSFLNRTTASSTSVRKVDQANKKMNQFMSQLESMPEENTTEHKHCSRQIQEQHLPCHLSPPVLKPPLKDFQYTSAGHSCSTSRKRSWREVCVDIIKNPYHEGKYIAKKMIKSVIRIDLGNEKDDRTGNIWRNNVNAPLKPYYGTPCGTNQRSTIDQSVTTKQGRSLFLPQANNTYPATNAGTDIYNDTYGTSSVNSTRPIQLVGMKIKLTEKEGNDVKDFQSSAHGEICKENVTFVKKVKKDREAFDEMKEELLRIRNDYDKTEKSYVLQHATSAGKKRKSDVSMFETKHTNIPHKMKSNQSESMFVSDLRMKKEDNTMNMESMDEVVETKTQLKESRAIQEKLKLLSMASFQKMTAYKIENDERKTFKTLQRKLISQDEQGAATSSYSPKTLSLVCNKENSFTSDRLATKETKSRKSYSQEVIDTFPNSELNIGLTQQQATTHNSQAQTTSSSLTIESKCGKNNSVLKPLNENDQNIVCPSFRTTLHSEANDSGLRSKSRSKSLVLNRVGTTPTCGVSCKKSTKHILNEDQGTANTSTPTTKKETTKKMALSTSHKIKSCCEQGTTDLTTMVIKTPTQTPRKTYKKQLSKRRRYMNGFKTATSSLIDRAAESAFQSYPNNTFQSPSQASLDMMTPCDNHRQRLSLPYDSPVQVGPPALPTFSDRAMFDNLWSCTNNDFRSTNQDHTQRLPLPFDSPTGVESSFGPSHLDSTFGPPPLPSIDRLCSGTSRRILIRPRRRLTGDTFFG